MQTLVSLLFGLALIVAIIGTISSLPFAIILKGAARGRATNLLITTATILVVLAALTPTVNQYTGSKSRPTKASPFGLDQEAKADIAGRDIQYAELATLLPRRYPQFAFLVHWISFDSRADALKEVQDSIDELAKKNELDKNIALRQAILLHETGHDYKNILERFTRAQTKLPDLLDALKYMDQAVAPDQLNALTTLVRNAVPEGWFRYRLLQQIYKNATRQDLVNVIEQAYQNSSVERLDRLLCQTLFELIIKAIGFVVLVLAIFCRGFLTNEQSPLRAGSVPPSTLNFKGVYGVGLSVFYSQVLAVIIMYACPPHFSSGAVKQAIIDSFLLGSSLLTTILCIHFFITKPAGEKVLQFVGCRAPSKWQEWRPLIGAGLCGFCAQSTMASLSALLMKHILHSTQNSSNPIILELINATLTGEVWALSLLFVLVAIVGPFAEEVYFRGIFYPWLRKNWGSIWAVIISAAAFAAIHIDWQSFLALFGSGVVLAVLYERQRSLIPCIITHGLWNASVVAYCWLSY